jgi:hypothetical protein
MREAKGLGKTPVERGGREEGLGLGNADSHTLDEDVADSVHLACRIDECPLSLRTLRVGEERVLDARPPWLSPSHCDDGHTEPFVESMHVDHVESGDGDSLKQHRSDVLLELTRSNELDHGRGRVSTIAAYLSRQHSVHPGARADDAHQTYVAAERMRERGVVESDHVGDGFGHEEQHTVPRRRTLRVASRSFVDYERSVIARGISALSFALGVALVGACHRAVAPPAYAVGPGPVEARAEASNVVPPDASVPTVAHSPTLPAYLDGFVAGAPGELVRVVSTEEGRTATNVESRFEPARDTEIVVYAAPNGNTLEQTLGRKRGEGESFRFDIQHVLAQVRFYRRLVPEKNVVLAVLEGPELSWPTWVKRHSDAPDRARELLLGQAPFARSPRISWVSHSGGGSLVLAAIDATRTVPAEVDRIVFLDSHYAFEPKSGHGQKLAAWLRSAPSHRLVAIAYDDRKIRLHGKRVVAPGGGSFRATERMAASFESERIRFVRDVVGPFQRARALEGRLDLRVHPNRENRILHSALVSDENGIVFSLGLGQGAPVEPRARFGRPRIFEAYVDPEPEPLAPLDAGTGANLAAH